MIALFPSEPARASGAHVRSVLDRIADSPAFALGAASASQGIYDPQQTLLDLGQGSRIQPDLYRPKQLPPLSLSGDSISGWAAVLRRARTAPATLEPGLLASSVPGGAAFVGLAGGPYAGVPNGAAFAPTTHPAAILASARRGRVGFVPLGPARTLAARAAARARSLTVVELSPGRVGEGQLAALLAARAPDELLLAVQSPPIEAGPQTLWLGVAGARMRQGGTLTSQSTHVKGIVSVTDLAPTILHALGIAIPPQMAGQRLSVQGTTDKGALVAFRRRIGVIDERKIPALKVFLLLWGALILALGLIGDRNGLRTGLRAGGAGVLWLPSLSLLAGGLTPGRTAELALLGGGALLLGLLCDRATPWPRAPGVPALAALALFAVDLLRGSPLLDRSELGPSPLVGVRFYGVGNDLEVASALLLLAAFAALTRRRERTGRSAALLVAGGVMLALFVAPGRLGADVGGIFTIAAGAGVGALMLLPRVSKRALALTLISPLLGLAALALIDVATGGGSHFLRSILHANSGSDIAHVIQRRYEVGFDTLKSGFNPILAGISLLAGAYAIRFRERLYAGVDTPWRAFLGGGFAAGLACSVFNDSGPLPLIQAAGVLALLSAYLRCPPHAPVAGAAPRTPGPGLPAGASSG
ncbi:MAG: hypothetical protein ACR2ND_07780 [Solirubrobacteraceae bacterium]